MKIIVDGDACPGISIITNIAKKYELEVIIYCDINHYITANYGEVRFVDSGFQSVDMKVVNECSNGDIIVSQDYGVAAICLGKKASVISPKGYIYTNENIGAMLEQRHLSQKIRRGGGKTPNAKKRTIEDDNRLQNNLLYLIKDKNIE
ncbi:MAG: YaiI/YqxD family protein [Clostridium celatum]|nr:YaiI/YqxD family protein [Clostridium celatum]MDO5779037.1 YaiI/YqxD family protein [Clostridium sp.]MDU2121346.1 YaiI/YqxD family protein [Clostridium celatum]MDU4978599.1 YaiI/YqxD family protein [Clostridium celatum]